MRNARDIMTIDKTGGGAKASPLFVLLLMCRYMKIVLDKRKKGAYNKKCKESYTHKHIHITTGG